MAIFYTDGGTANNGRFGFQKSVICVADKNGKNLMFEDIGDKTNNEAELMAIYYLLSKTNKKKYEVYCDSTLAVNLVSGKFHTKIDRLKKILQDISSLNKQVKMIWIPRELNKAGWIIENTLGL